MPEYTNKVDAVLDHAKDFTRRDFLELALAALDQYGLDAASQESVRLLVGKLERCTNCGGKVDGYEADARDEKVAPADGLCEWCHADAVKSTKRRKAEDDYEAHCDARGVAMREAVR